MTRSRSEVAVTVDDDTLVADFTGTAPQSRGPVNCTLGRSLGVQDGLPRDHEPRARRNDGFFRPFAVVPPGTVFSAEPPSPTGWYYEATAFATELVWKALAPVVPERLGAGSYASLCRSATSSAAASRGEVFVLAEPNDGGWGADADADGESALIATTDGDTYNFPVEVVESRFPLQVERYELNTAAEGGAGRRRGGFGVVREYRCSTSSGRRLRQHRRLAAAPVGARRGEEGSNNYLEYVRDGTFLRHGRVSRIALERGDRVAIVTGAAAATATRSSASRSSSLDDVRDGYVTAEQARSVYGVVVDGRRVDEDDRRVAGERGGPMSLVAADGYRRHVHRPRLLRHRDARDRHRQGVDDTLELCRGRARQPRGRRRLARPRGRPSSSTARRSSSTRSPSARGAHGARHDRGFRDVLEIGRGNRPDMYNLVYRKPEPFVPRRLRFEVTERVDRTTDRAGPLDLRARPRSPTPAGRRASRRSRSASCTRTPHPSTSTPRATGSSSCSRRARLDLLGDHARVARVRATSTAVLNGYVQPVVALPRRPRRGARRDGLSGSFHVMQSNGDGVVAGGAPAADLRSSSPARPAASSAPRGRRADRRAERRSTSTSAARRRSAR